MLLKNLLRFFLLLLYACFLVTALRSSVVAPSVSVSPLMPVGMCHMRMAAYDGAPGNGWKEHNKSVSVDSDTDYTKLYRRGKVYITYNDPSHGGWYFDRHAYWVQPDQLNVWDIRTRWTWFNPAFASGDWELWYPC